MVGSQSFFHVFNSTNEKHLENVVTLQHIHARM